MSSVSSDARIAANQANAQHSTGPVTPEGKARCAQNATKHGLNCAGLIVTAEMQPLFDKTQSELRALISPEGPLEETAFDKLLTARWNMIRAKSFEQDLQAKINGVDPQSHPDTQKEAQLYSRYYLRYEGSYTRALKELKDLQTVRAMSMVIHPEPDQILPALLDPIKLNRFVEQTHRRMDLPVKSELLKANYRLKETRLTLLRSQSGLK